jgi:class 3 adenylate cyclase/tetratricopeptide (TPR) repeat protein
MTCPNCGQENEAGQKFCGNCGTKLAAACPTCGTANPPGNRFCGECGTDLGAGGGVATSAAATAEPSIDLERRIVSVLFVDLVNYTSFSEGRDAEDVRSFLSDYFDRSREIIERFGGVVEKFIGDAVMAAWGAVAANEDDAERAVRAGMELVDMVAKLGADAGVPEMAARAGVLTGEASVRSDTNSEGMVIGDLVNTAARLQGSAEPGTVYVGETTYRAAGDSIQFEEIGSLDMKGKELPVSAWKALRIVAQIGGALRSDGLEPPFTGRAPELRMLKDQLHAAEREQRARLISVIGQAGIGKSRLVWEFQKYIDGLISDIYWHQGRSPAYGDNLAFWAVGEMVRHRARIAETDDAATTRSRLRETVDRYIPDPDEQSWVEPHLEGLLGLGDGHVGEGSEQAAAYRLLFERIAAKGTTVLVFEDLHWADPALLDFVEELTDWSRDHPILVITLARADLLDRRPTWGAGKRGFISLNLSPLSDEDMGALVSGLVPGISDETLGGVVERSGGVPMYAVEFVRMLLGRGDLSQRNDGTFEITGDLAELAVPESVSAVIGARLDRLADEDRSLLQDAAVMGYSFSLESLAFLTDQSKGDLETNLATLVRHELLEVVRDPRSPERGQYRFVQSLIREVAHARVSRDVRRARHLKVADFFSSLDDEELAGIVAFHLVEALRATTDSDDAARLLDRAQAAMLSAIDRADDLSAWDQCLGLAKQAEEFFTDSANLLPFLERATAAAEHLARYDECEAYARRCIEVAQDLGDLTAEARAMSLLGTAYNVSNRSKRAVEILTPYLADHPDPEGDEGLTRAFMALARAQMLAGEGDPAATALVAMRAAELLDLDEVATQAMITRGTVLSSRGRPRESMALLREALKIAEDNGLVGAKLRALANIGYGSPDPQESIAATNAGYEESRRLGDKSHLQFFAGNWASYRIYMGDYDAPATITDDPVFADAPANWWAHHYAYLSSASASKGNVDQAKRELDKAQEYVGDSDDPQLLQAVQTASMTIAWAEGRFRDGLDEALDLSRRFAYSHGIIIYFARNSALRSGDPALIAEYRDRLSELPADTWVREFRRELQALDQLETGDTGALREAVHRWSGYWSSPPTGIVLLVSGALQLPEDHPERSELIDEARRMSNEIGLTTVPIDVALGRVTSA